MALITLVAAGPQGPGSADDNASRPAGTALPKNGKELPVAIASAEPALLTVTTLSGALAPELADDAPFTERTLWELRTKTVAMAGTPGKTSATCEGGKVSEAPGATTRCTVTYEGQEVTWSIEFEMLTDDLNSYDITNAGHAVLTAKSVHGHFLKECNGVSKYLRCDKVPDVEGVAYDQDTGHHCQYASTVDGEARWVDIPVSVGECGVVFDNGRSPKSF
ncbi:hypothetical protein HFP71_09650 [Streptomyces sp. ARC32]